MEVPFAVLIIVVIAAGGLMIGNYQYLQGVYNCEHHLTTEQQNEVKQAREK